MLARHLLTRSLPRYSARCSASLSTSLPPHSHTLFNLSPSPSRSYSQTHISSAAPYTTRTNPPWISGIRVVPQQSAWVVERLGRFHRILEPGLRVMIPFIDQIAYVHSLKEETLTIADQTAVTKDNVTIRLDGVLYIRVTDAFKASYGVQDPVFAITSLAQTTMRSELGKLTLDKTFEEREHLNAAIVQAINQASMDWGIECMRYEIRDIQPPEGVRRAMDLQAEAERKKRAQILDSEGAQQSQINVARGHQQSMVLEAAGEAAALKARAQAQAQALNMVSSAIRRTGGADAVSFRIAERYIDAFSKLAKRSTTVLMPNDTGDPTSFIAKAMAMYNTISAKQKQTSTAGRELGDVNVEDDIDPEEWSVEAAMEELGIENPERMAAVAAEEEAVRAQAEAEAQARMELDNHEHLQHEGDAQPDEDDFAEEYEDDLADEREGAPRVGEPLRQGDEFYQDDHGQHPQDDQDSEYKYYSTDEAEERETRGGR